MEIRAIQQKGNYWINVARDLYETRLAIKELRKKEETIVEELKEMSNHTNAFGGPYIFTVSFRKGAIEYEIVPELKGVDLDKYRKEDVANWKIQKIS